jgi:hypothetical protein
MSSTSTTRALGETRLVGRGEDVLDVRQGVTRARALLCRRGARLRRAEGEGEDNRRAGDHFAKVGVGSVRTVQRDELGRPTRTETGMGIDAGRGGWGGLMTTLAWRRLAGLSSLDFVLIGGIGAPSSLQAERSPRTILRDGDYVIRPSGVVGRRIANVGA